MRPGPNRLHGATGCLPRRGRQAALRLAVRRAHVVQDRHQRGLEPREVARDPAELGLLHTRGR